MEILRPTHPDDVPAILALIAEVYGEYDCHLDTADEPHWLDPGPYFRKHGGEFWVVELDGLVRATAAVKLHPDAGEVKCLYVHRSLRGRGWGKRLTELTMDFARAAGKTKMILWSDTRFLHAHALYRAMGFTQLPETRDLNDSNNSVEYAFEKGL